MVLFVDVGLDNCDLYKLILIWMAISLPSELLKGVMLVFLDIVVQ